MSTKHLFLSLVLAMGAVSVPAQADKLPLSEAAMAKIRGGMAVESFTNPATSFQVVDRDNMQLSGSFSEGFDSQEIAISVFAGDSKIGSQLVSTGAPDANGSSRGSFAFRSWQLSEFPIGDRAGKNLTVRYRVPPAELGVTDCNQDPNVPCIKVAGGSENFPRNGITLDDNVIVNRVRIHNLTDGTESSFLDPQLFGVLLDNLDFNQDRLISPSVDAILAQCATARRVQLRLDTSYDAGAFMQVPGGCVRQSTCRGGFGFYRDLAARNLNVFHIFIVNDAGGDAIGRAPIGDGNFILLRQNLDSSGFPPLVTASTIAHEILHTRDLDHTSDNATNCDPAPTEAARRKRNVMCAMASNPFVLPNGQLAGDATFLSTRQCNAIRRTPSSPLRPRFALDIN